MHLLALLIAALGVAALPGTVRTGPKLSKRFLTEPRASTLDWNAPRPSSSALFFNLTSPLSETYFNSPHLLSRSIPEPPSSPNPSTILSRSSSVLTSRAQSGRWESMHGSIYKPPSNPHKYPPAACSWHPKRVDVYYMSTLKTCQYKYVQYDHPDKKYQSWQPWEDIGGELDGPPAVCTRKKENYHVFCKGSDGQAWHKSYDHEGQKGWGRWQSMGGKVKYPPAACSWGKEHASVYVGADDGSCWMRRYDETKVGEGKWQGWYNLGGYMASPPKVVTWGEEHASVYCKGEDGQAWHKKTDPKKGSGWGEWESLGGSLDSPVAACAWKDRMDVYVKGSDGACWHKTYKEEETMLPKWGAWENLGGEMKADTPPDVVVVDDGMEVYITGEDDKVYRKKWQDGSWTSQDWEPMGGNVETGPVTVGWGEGDVDLFFTGKDGEVKRCF
ncbi:hypothetical protein QBC34DRAFT_467789 [Podospora aff. communis PSN243]|uniref:PLL-like beta propeller domain-containing protein n=1 Tax=Podospora aff. communis PSN243 TaxID=3040156 RepID=A0AAV9GH48_9PEZI|nr:hypothetical protein QBC34DRAFT_467789 [Podospora aff. communis PSN243]